MSPLTPETLSDFHAEAHAYLPKVEECLRLLNGNPQDSVALCELRRLTQGLRSVTAAIGLTDASDIAQSAGELADAIAEGAMPLDAEAIELFRDALSELAKCLPAADGKEPAAVRRAPKADLSGDAPPRIAIEVPAELVVGFLDEAIELIDRAGENLKRFANGEHSQEVLLEIRRAIHTLKGSAAMVGMKGLSQLSHAMEDVLDELRDGKRQPSREVHDLFQATLDAAAESVENRGAEPAAYAELLARYRELRGEAPLPAAPPLEASTPVESAAGTADSPQSVRVPLDHLDSSLRGIGEFSVIRAGWDQQLAAHRRQLDEFALAVRRCQRIALRLETEYAVYSPGETGLGLGELWPGSGRSEFDALEFDRYTEFHLLSRDLSEAVSDLVTIESQLSSLASEFESTRGRFARSTAELQDNIIRMRMAPVGILRTRLERTVRTAAAALGKHVSFEFNGAATELDKAAIESLAAPLEHILRNAVAHGIEDAETRAGSGKPAAGTITVTVAREGSNAVFQVSDDGGGVDEQRVRQIAVRNGLITPAQAASLQGKTLQNFLFEPGFSTADQITEVSGRGVGLDIVRSAVESLKGTVAVESIAGLGTTFTLRLPLSQSILRVLFVEAANQTFALPLANVLRAGKAVVIAASGGERIRQVALEEVLHLSGGTPQARSTRPAVVLDCGSEQIALLVNRILEIREVLVSPPKGLLKKAPAIAGTTTLVDGSVVLVLQPPKLSRAAALTATERPIRSASQPLTRGPLEVLVIDDSVSVRRIVTNTLRKQGWNVTSAKDGLEALEVLHSMPRMPDAILVDVEMPRMDGYDFTVALRSEAHHTRTPVIMLTSRGGDKHRRKAFDVGVTDFLVKPYMEETLVATIRGHAFAGQQT